MLAVLCVLCVAVPVTAGAQESDPVPTDPGAVDPIPTEPGPVEVTPADSATPEPQVATTVPLIAPAGDGDERAPTQADQASRRIDMVVIALVALAAIVFVATIVFVFRTRPERVSAAEAELVGKRVRAIERPAEGDPLDNAGVR